MVNTILRFIKSQIYLGTVIVIFAVVGVFVGQSLRTTLVIHPEQEAAVVSISALSINGGVPTGTGITSSLPIPGIKKIMAFSSGSIFYVYNGQGAPPKSLKPYLLPGVSLPTSVKDVKGTKDPVASPESSGAAGTCAYWATLNWLPPLATDVTLSGPPIGSAELQGLKPVSVPAIGDLVVWAQGQVGNMTYGTGGHMAIVVAVDAQDKTFTVSEMNDGEKWAIDYRVVSSLSGGIDGFIPGRAG
jgi:hypothetical protein